MRLTRSARVAQRLREKQARRALGNVWLQTLRTAAVVAVAAAGLAFIGAKTGSIGVQVSTGLLVAAATLWCGYGIALQHSTNVSRYLAARRLREHDLTRKAPVEFCVQLPDSVRTNELIARREDVVVLMSTLPPMGSLARAALDSMAVRACLIALLPVYAILFLSADQIKDSFFPRLTLVVVGGLALAMFTTLALMRRRVRHAIRENSCPDCGYALAQVPSTLSQIRPELNLGPKRCPECGSPWPLIPLTLGQRLPDATAFHPSPSTPPPPPRANPDA